MSINLLKVKYVYVCKSIFLIHKQSFLQNNRQLTIKKKYSQNFVNKI